MNEQSQDFSTMESSEAPQIEAPPTDAPEVERSITIRKPAAEVYRSWRDPQNLRQIMKHFAEVGTMGEERQHWRINAPLGQSLEWEARIVEEHPDSFLRWASLPGAKLPNEGSLRLSPAPGDRGTEAKLYFRFDPPGGVLGEAAVKLLGFRPGMVAEKALRRFKSLVETGEIPTTEHQPAARKDTD
jgi:uncharacterized membrane protein